MKKNEEADKLIQNFFKNLDIEKQFYSKKLGQPVLLIGEEKLYKALQSALTQQTLSL